LAGIVVEDTGTGSRIGAVFSGADSGADMREPEGSRGKGRRVRAGEAELIRSGRWF
jgi:hypothetical protein